MSSSRDDVDAKIADYVSAVELGYWQSDFAQHENCKILLELCLAHKHPMLGYAYLLYGRTFMIVGDLEGARSNINKGVEFCKKNRDLVHLPMGLLWLGGVYERLKIELQAFKFWHQCLSLSLEQSNLEVAVEVYLNIGALYQKAGWREESASILKSCFSMSEAIDSRKLLAKSGIFLSEMLIEGQDYEGALLIISRSELDVILHADITWIVQICKSKAECYWHTGSIEAAIESYESGRVMAKKFEMAWAYISISISYAKFLLASKSSLKAEFVINEMEPYFSLFPDDGFKSAWLKLRYECSKNQCLHQEALMYLKSYHDREFNDRDVWEIDGTSTEFKRMLKKKYELLRREFRKCERVVELSGVRVTMQQMLRFKERCDRGLESGRIIELIVQPENKKIIEQRSAMVVSDHCANDDLWLNVSSGHYYIFPADKEKSLFEFSNSLGRAIKLQPWARLKIQDVNVRTRILLANQEILDQVTHLIQRGWHDA